MNATTSLASAVVVHWRRWVLWTGVPLCLLGLVVNRFWQLWPLDRSIESVILALCALAASWVMHRTLGWSLAAALAVAWSAGVVVFAGAVPVAATLLFALAAIALGDLIAGKQQVALLCACGLAVFAGVIGWLLPLPIHFRGIYLALCLGLIAWRHQPLREILADARLGWRSAVTDAPRTAAFAMVVLGLASVPCWLPTLQVDDLVYHLRLPWELMEHGRYALEPRVHVWALAPWAGDVLQAIPQLLAGAEARGPMNALWIALSAAGVWHLTQTLGGSTRASWLAVALYGSLPLTAALAGGMQTETPTVALLLWLLGVILREPGKVTGNLRLASCLAGGLIAMKLAAAISAAVIVACGAWRRRGCLHGTRVLGAIALTLALGSASYAYAWAVAGNPFLPLFNAWFHSPYFKDANLDDPRWHAGFDAMLPWQLTFETGRYMETYAGGAGFVLVGLGGAWLLALIDRRTFVMTAIASVVLVLPLIPLQYLRYAFPGLVLLLPALVVTSFRVDPRGGTWLLAILVLLNVAFQANSHWMLRSSVVRQTVKALGRDATLYESYAPERILIARLRDLHADTGAVLALDPGSPYVGELGERGRTPTWYDPTMQHAARNAERDPSGAAWLRLFKTFDVREVVLHPTQLSPAQRAGLVRARGYRRSEVGKAEWWSLPARAPAP